MRWLISSVSLISDDVHIHIVQLWTHHKVVELTLKFQCVRIFRINTVIGQA